MIFSLQNEDHPEDAFMESRAVDIVKELQRLKDVDGDFERGGTNDNDPTRRKTIQNLERDRKRAPPIGTLDVAFRKRFMNISNEEGNDIGK